MPPTDAEIRDHESRLTRIEVLFEQLDKTMSEVRDILQDIAVKSGHIDTVATQLTAQAAATTSIAARLEPIERRHNMVGGVLVVLGLCAAFLLWKFDAVNTAVVQVAGIAADVRELSLRVGALEGRGKP